MRANKENNKLLSTLQSLHRKLALALLYFRESTYRNIAGKGKTSNIKAIINAKIDELASSLENTPLDKGDLENTTVVKRDAGDDKTSDYKSNENHLPRKAVENELSRYIKTESLTSVTQPGIVKKLTESIWEHIHNTLRAARQGDTDKAKLHLDIVDQALNEVGHYMSGDDFSKLVNSVEQYLQKLEE